MKSLITLFFNGDLIDHPKEDFKLIVWINEHKHPIEKISRQIALWDNFPYLNTCKIRLSLYDCTNLNKGILSSRKEIEEMPVIGEHRFSFVRYLNDKIQVYPKVEFPSEGKCQLVNHMIECSTSGFSLLKINPLLLESHLSAITVNHITYPIELSLYFEDFNVKQIINAQTEGKKLVYLLRIVNVVGIGKNTITIYYQSYVNKTDSFPVIDKVEEKNEIINKIDEDPRQADLLTFDDWDN